MGVFSFRNSTDNVVEWEGSSARRFAMAEILLTSFSSVLTILVAVSMTRRMKILVSLAVSVISLMCYALIFFIIGCALSAPVGYDLSIIFACSVLLLVGLVKSMVWQSIPDNNASYAFQYLIGIACAIAILALVFPFQKFIAEPLIWLLVAPILLLRLQQIRASHLSGTARKRIKDDLLISEYMAKKYKPERDAHPDELKGLNYIVGGEVQETRYGIFTTINYDKLVTVEDTWKEVTPTDFYATKIRDTSLSFALFKLLRRRFRGCYIHESDHPNTRNFVLQGMLSDPHQFLRAFQVIEMELSFLYDFFHINHLPDFIYASICLAFIVCVSMVIYITTIRQETSHKYISVFFKEVNLDEKLTSAILSLFLCFGCMQLYSVFYSKWNKVNVLVYLCQRHKHSSRHSSHWILSRFLLPFFYAFSTGSYWPNEARQYSLLHHDSHHRGSLIMSILFVAELLGFSDSCTYFDDSSMPFPLARKISKEAKQALMFALKISDGRLNDGKASLSRNKMTLSWACNHEFVAETVLVWHVATSLCNVGFIRRTNRRFSAETKKNHEVATMLSGYCAYLVGFAPELIADDIYATRLAFDNACTVAKERVEGEGSLGKMYESAKLMEDLGDRDFAGSAQAQNDVVFQGKMLAANLIKLSVQNDKHMWKVLADFWAELMLFISPANNAAAHLEKLKTGGELITHTWALLTHAGILERPARERQGNNTYGDQTECQQTSLEYPPAQNDNEVKETTTSFEPSMQGEITIAIHEP